MKKNMNLVITNSVQTTFAVSRALNCTDRTPDGAYTNDTGSIVITTVDPGLFSTCPVQAYTGGSDFVKTLPFIPEQYLIGVRKTYTPEGRGKVSSEDKAAKENLLIHIANASEVIFASNGGSEDMTKFTFLCQMTNVGQKISRMWLTTLSNKAINYSYRHRHSGISLARIARSGFVQLASDLLFRTNVEQALGQSYGKGAFPMERMDIAALWLLCNSYDHRKIKRRSTPKYSVSVTGEWNGATVKMSPVDIWTDKSVADEVYEKIKLDLSKTVETQVIEVTEQEDRRKRLNNMGSLQIDALRRLGFLQQKTMAVADSLFEKGLISSPRTSVAYLSSHLRNHIERRFPECKNYPFYTDESMPYCHGIITTSREPLFLSEGEQALYNLISNRMKVAFADPHRYKEVAVFANIAGVDFYGSAEVPEEYEHQEDTIEMRLTGTGVSTSSEKQPKPLTAADFLQQLYQTVWGNTGIVPILPMSGWNDCGASIQRLIDNGFVSLTLDEIAPTEKARVLMIHTAHLELADIGKFISQVSEMDELAESRRPTRPVMAAYEEWLKPQILSLVTDPKVFANKVAEYKCPKCGNKGMRLFPTNVTCDCCGCSIPRHIKGYDLTEKDIEQLILYKYTSPIYGFVGQGGRKFCDSLVLDYKYGVTFAAKAAKIYS